MAAISEKHLARARFVSVVAATVISLACGTNYAYSAWGPAFAERLVLSSTQSNLIGVWGNLGMYGAGIPVGWLVDTKGPRFMSACGCLTIAVGYFFLYRAYEHGPGSMSLPLVCMFTFLTGAGGGAAFSGSIKTAALNFPQGRGTATAFPLSAFGLSASFFSLVSSVALPNDTAGFLLFLSIGTFFMIASSTVFLRLLPHAPAYSMLQTEESSHETRSLRRKREDEEEPGTRDQSTSGSKSIQTNPANEATQAEMPEISKLNTEDSSHAGGDLGDMDDEDGNGNDAHTSLYADVRGWALFHYLEFYQFFGIIGLLTGVGLMTINNIGNDAQALWSHWDASIPTEFIRHRQLMHVSIISIGSFLGRLLSGIGSDVIVKKLQMSRLWCLVISSLLFGLAQIIGIKLNNPNFLFLLSGVSGLAYGFLFGCFPSIVAETFGTAGLSQNWGTLTLAPIIFANVFNLLYGRIYDAHSELRPSGHRECEVGHDCYKNAYWMTFGSSVAALAMCLWTISHGEKVKRVLGEKGGGGRRLA